MQTKLDHALDLADRGYAVFPCHSPARNEAKCSCGKSDCTSPAKHPRVLWRDEATDDEDQIRAWWGEWPDANIGLATGPISGLWVLDLDQKDYGPENFEGFRAGRDLAPAVVKTGGGGAHLLFAWEDHAEVRNRAGVLRGVDVRGDGGYVIAPGSVHASGALYEWAVDVEPTPSPAWLLELVCGEAREIVRPAKPSVVRVIDETEERRIRSALEAIDADGRDEWLRVGMALHSTDAGEQAYGIWSDWSQGSAKFDPVDQEKTWRHFSKRNDAEVTLSTVFFMAQDAGWIPPESRTVEVAGIALEVGNLWSAKPEAVTVEVAEEPFPIDRAFPQPWAREFVEAIAHSYQVPIDMPAMLLLPILSTCLAAKYEIAPTGSWVENTALWAAVAMRSGERKSAVLGEILRPLHRWERERGKDMAAKRVAHEHDVQMARAKLKAARDKAAQGKPGMDAEALHISQELAAIEALEPKTPSVVASEPTTESLAQLLGDNDERFLVASPEADPLDTALGRYSSGSPNLGVWLAGHAGDSYKVTRRTRDHDLLSNPRLSVAITPQPQAMRQLFGSRQAIERGFVARFLFSVPTSTMGRRRLVHDGVPANLRENWDAVCSWALELGVPDEPCRVTLDAEALARFESWWVELEESFLEGGRSVAMRAWYSKLAGTVLRIALALHGMVLPWEPSRTTLGLEEIERALDWVPYLEAHLRRAMGEVTEDPDATLAQRLLVWLADHDRDGGEVTRREAFDALRGASAVGRVKDIDGALGLLVDGGWLREQTAGSRRGRPSVRYSVHPALSEHLRRPEV
jgi:hypothetical protein